MLIHILPEIFVNLSVGDLLRCRQVCRAWSHAVERDFIKELCLYMEGEYILDTWHIDSEPIDRRSVLKVNELSVLSDPNFIQNFPKSEKTSHQG